MEDLTRSQFILLVLFVSFFSSTVVGIVIVSLMEQAPKDVTRVIQRTIVQTVEKVAPKEIQTKVVTQEKKVMVSEADTIKSAISKATPSVVFLHNDNQHYYGVGVVVSSDGVVVAPAGLPQQLKASLADKSYTLELVKNFDNFALYRIKDAQDTLPPIAILTSPIQLGSKTIALTGKQTLAAYDGIVSKVSDDYIITSFKPGSGSSAILISSSGALAGFSGRSDLISQAKFINSSKIMSAIKALSQTQPQPTNNSENTQQNQNQDTQPSIDNTQQTNNTATSTSE